MFWSCSLTSFLFFHGSEILIVLSFCVSVCFNLNLMKKKLSIVIREKDRERKIGRKRERERERVVKRFLDLKVELQALEKMFSG